MIFIIVLFIALLIGCAFILDVYPMYCVFFTCEDMLHRGKIYRVNVCARGITKQVAIELAKDGIEQMLEKITELNEDDGIRSMFSYEFVSAYHIPRTQCFVSSIYDQSSIVTKRFLKKMEEEGKIRKC